MTYKLLKVETYIKKELYQDLEKYLQKYKKFSYSFLEYIKFIRDEHNDKNLDTIINNFNYNELNKTETPIRNDDTYRENVKKICNNRCVVTDNLLCNEVAHILEFKDCDCDNDRYCKFNGIFIKQYIHTLWDKEKLIIINFCDKEKKIFFKINVDKLNKEENANEKLNEIIRECSIPETEYKNKSLEEIRIPVNINEENLKNHFNEYKNYINRRNGFFIMI
jgi:hypothetical protein